MIYCYLVEHLDSADNYTEEATFDCIDDAREYIGDCQRDAAVTYRILELTYIFDDTDLVEVIEHGEVTP